MSIIYIYIYTHCLSVQMHVYVSVYFRATASQTLPQTRATLDHRSNLEDRSTCPDHLSGLSALCCRARDSRLSMLTQMLPMVLPLLGCCDINLLLCNTTTVAQTKDRTSRCGSYVVGRSAVITKVTKDKPVLNNASRYHGAITCTKNMTYWSMFTVIFLRSRSSCAIAFPLLLVVIGFYG